MSIVAAEQEGTDPVQQGSTPSLDEIIACVADTDVTMLLQGESGVGKGVTAEMIHQHSSRRAGPFVKVNCAAIPAELIESELFGHERGAFSGAVQRKRGRFELADGGNLF